MPRLMLCQLRPTSPRTEICLLEATVTQAQIKITES